MAGYGGWVALSASSQSVIQIEIKLLKSISTYPVQQTLVGVAVAVSKPL